MSEIKKGTKKIDPNMKGPFNPAFDQNGLKQWWKGQIKITNKTVKVGEKK